MKIKSENWYGFDHEKVKEQFGGELTFINYIPIKGTTDYVPVAVYKAANPDREKGHKTYMLLYSLINKEGKSQFFVSGREEADFNEDRFVTGIHCLECDEVLYSVHRHNMNGCSCKNEAFVDGGRDYTRCGAVNLDKIETVTVDLLLNTVVTSTPKTS